MVEGTRLDFSKYANSYYLSLVADVGSEDLQLIKERVLPNFWMAVANPFKWTEKQISEDDDLLEACKEAYQAQEQKEKEDMDKARSDFNERLEGWLKKEPEH